MNVLFVTEQFPYPLDTGGNVRTFHLLRALSAEHRVTLLSGRRQDLTDAQIEVVKGFCAEVHLIDETPVSVRREVSALWRTAVNGAPFVLERHRADEFSRQIAQLSQTRSGRSAFDVVHFNHLDAALYRADVPTGTRCVLDQHNVVSNQVKTTLHSEHRAVRKAVLRFDYPRLQRYEAELCNRMDTCLVCSDADAQSLAQLGVRTRMLVIPNGVDLGFFELGPSAAADARQLVFVGTLDYDPCEQGVWYFCNEILPLIRAQLPEVNFMAVGRNPSKRLQDLAAAHPGIELPGRVEDVRPYVHRAAVSVVPLLSGSGTRLKILEAMAMGSPVVSTSIGAEGIEARDGDELSIADTPASFADAVLALMRDPGLAMRLRTRGRELVERKYSWRGVANDLLDEYRRLAQTQRGAAVG